MLLTRDDFIMLVPHAVTPEPGGTPARRGSAIPTSRRQMTVAERSTRLTKVLDNQKAQKRFSGRGKTAFVRRMSLSRARFAGAPGAPTPGPAPLPAPLPAGGSRTVLPGLRSSGADRLSGVSSTSGTGWSTEGDEDDFKA